ncbi:DNA-directed RNA polymerase II large subunit, putative [Babesia bigemina]|uniref:DNA-directed RNA polymerase II large subunit, putative n=1 Tax=Babesia bigemina TaxID=5866 RepID=A0A061D2D4_BABBI|nr:DNA-directed RNA polymerase II large subunit, putative [Babesia bigemina]CDR94763.1 DNA-directed RNA polymerase II large subunit, putative [Babesia bigemina]|eukprot:XP_012766949.1 DNA-directed RNA polymerase II large subunit, putative [Babesia bigemina]
MVRQQSSAVAISLDKLNEQIIEATIEKCASFTNNRILGAIKQKWTEVLRQRLDAVNRGEHVTHIDTYSTAQQQPAPEDSDNDFDDAEVESAQGAEILEKAAAAKADLVEPQRAEPAQAEQPAADNADDDLSISDVSELDDQEPETKDLVIGVLDKLTRPSRKKSGAHVWKVKLKYGVLQVNGLEVPFEKLEGEFEF